MDCLPKLAGRTGPTLDSFAKDIIIFCLLFPAEPSGQCGSGMEGTRFCSTRNIDHRIRTFKSRSFWTRTEMICCGVVVPRSSGSPTRRCPSDNQLIRNDEIQQEPSCRKMWHERPSYSLETGSIIVTDLGRRRRQRSTPPRASRRPVTNDTLMCKLQFYDDEETST
ncbi:uncharacterized protein LOC6046362 isoform X2 [Culex quinquefasciatus]|uniref:uncharacterized protein LOC6046362 isoform X2 n=1 Tax=Culex quinquefasciatus TaxID=7176 RepID=UPI0018E3EE33|nr:uncharacterized protein LOC6046362 isoform X2 [Culex quinquefasciatus]